MLYEAGYYVQALFWAHLVLEKLCKALWVYKKNRQDYPYIHNLLRLIKESNVELSQGQIEFYAEMNQFQAQGRYDGTMRKAESSLSKEDCEHYLSKIKDEMKWLASQIQTR